MKHYHVHWHGLDDKKDILAGLKEIQTHMSALDDKLKSLTDAETAEAVVVAKAIALLQGIPAQIQAAVDAALAAGATAAQLASLDSLKTAIDSDTAGLTAAEPA